MSIIISTQVWKHSRQSGNALLLLLALADLANDNGICWPGIPTLAERTRMTIRNVQKLLRQLESAGEIAIGRNQGMNTSHGKTNQYKVTCKGVNSGTSGESQDTSRGERTDTSRGEQWDTSRGERTDTQNHQIHPSGQSSGDSSSDEDWMLFQEFGKDKMLGSVSSKMRGDLLHEFKRLGRAQTMAVLERCGGANSWKYILKALCNQVQGEGSDGAKWWDDQYGVNVPTPAPDTPTLSAEESEPTKRELNRWPLAIAMLEVRLDRREFDAWMRGAELLSLEDGVCRIGVRTAHAAAMLRQRLAVQVRGILSDILGEIKTVEFEVQLAEV